MTQFPLKPGESRNVPSFDNLSLRRRDLFALAASALCLSVESKLTAQETHLSQNLVFEKISEFAELRAATIVQIKLIDSTNPQPSSWNDTRKLILQSIKNQEDLAIKEFLKALEVSVDSPDAAREEEGLVSAMSDINKSLIAYQRDLQRIASRTTESETPSSEPEVSNQSQGVPATGLQAQIVLASPFEAALQRTGIYDDVAGLLKREFDKLKLNGTFNEDLDSSIESALFSRTRDWRWKIATKQHTRPQDITGELAFVSLLKTSSQIATLDLALSKLEIDPADPLKDSKQEDVTRATELLGESRELLKEGFDELRNKEETSRFQEAETKIALAHQLVRHYFNQ